LKKIKNRMKENEITVTYMVDKDLMKAFENAQKQKEKELGISLSKKQAFQLALKEAIENWVK
jgi:hypothetical protein